MSRTFFYDLIRSGAGLWNSSAKYATPFLGRYLLQADQLADYARMQSDFRKNTGRSIKYPSIRGFDTRGWSTLGNMFESGMNQGMRTYRKLI